eukprot:CAMPEP_0171059314 /NCGR_PEP_ID=MMETSP0766_2-20121228/3110_1 /TAXON_ID=439317 /ORGANISM="Gambierdiscus australes, Strain CAWD 149" /LENGTH=496 /DNA_ID=CAMNT_0011514741 /DNA_START=54 /DNA_END=1544 /DNA_ORIENTATION=-
MAGQSRSLVARELVELCKDLEHSGTSEVAKLYRAAEVALGQRQEDAAFRQAVQAAVKLMHGKALQLMTSGAHLPKDASNKAEVFSKDAIKCFQALGDKAGEALALGLVADIYVLAGETTKALKSAHASVSLFRRLDDKASEALVLGSIVTAHLVKATAGFNPQLELADKADEKMEQMRQQRETEMDLAMEAAKEVVTLHRSMGERKAEAEALDKVAGVHLLKEESEQCKAVAREERALYQEINDVKGEASALQTVINANLLSEEDYEDALIAAKDMVKLFRGRDRKTDDEDKQGIADSLQALAKVQHTKFDLADALASAKEAQDLYKEIGEKKLSAPCCQTLAQIYLSMQKPEEAIKCLKQAAEDFGEAGDKLAEANALHEWALTDMDDLLTEVEKDPKTFSQKHATRLNAAWRPLEDSLALYRELKNGDGECYVIETINTAIERSRQIHIRVAEPHKTIYITDPVTREVSALHIFDTSLPEGAPEGEELELADGE